ncbi:MAG: hypothetical protein HY958_04115 [Bacteroidia bacterium]|nr:hypothetical protein [Bacteroidia bacterium]
MSIITEYPVWFIIFCIGIAFLYSFLLYRKDKNFKETALWWLRTMRAFRFIVVFFLTFLLLSPFIKSFSKFIEKPVIIIAQDNSESILMNKDSLLYKKNLKTDLENFVQKLSSDFEVKTYSFGDEIKKGMACSFTDKQTDFSELMNELKNKFINRNVGALVLASDGIYNKGSNPLYLTSDINYPVYTIALGDTSTQKDIILSKVIYNKIVFLGNKFPLQIYVDVKELNGIGSQLNVYNNGRKLFSKPILVNSKSYSEIVNVETDADKTGIQHYKIEAAPVKDEISVSNNYKDIVIDVIDSKQKILVLANSPHPDIAALRKALETNLNLQVDFFIADKLTNPVWNYNLVILHQLPSKTNSFIRQFSDIFNKSIPVLFILGSQSSFENINNLKTGFEIRQTKNAYDETQGIFNKQFSFFQVSDEMQEFIGKAPPLICPFGEYRSTDAQNILFYQKISNITTSRPLILFSINGENKIGFISGEGIWRWRMNNFLNHANHELFDELINKMVQFLALKVNKDNFVITNKKIVNENEPLIFEAEVYNETFELINTPDVSLEIINPRNKKFQFILDKTNNAYRLNAGIFPIGDYSWSAKVKVGKKEFTKNGKFTVVSLNMEGERTVADHKLLYQLSGNNNGKLFTPAQMDKLYEAIKTNRDIVPVSYSEKQLIDIINLRWIFFLLLALASAEWFSRKYFGSY